MKLHQVNQLNDDEYEDPNIYYLGESAYARSKEVHISKGIYCDKCKIFVNSVPVLSADTSDDEYGPVSVCKTCIDDMFNKYYNLDNKKN